MIKTTAVLCAYRDRQSNTQEGWGIQHMRRASLVLIISLAVLAGIGLFLLESLFIVQRVAAVSNPTGAITIRPEGSDAFVNLGDTKRVMAGTVIKTGSDGGLMLNWVDGSRIKVGPNTTMQVLKCQVNRARSTESYLFRLDLGRVWVRVLKRLSQRSKFEISTPTATAAVRGTIFSVAVAEDGSTSVSVLRGQVDVMTDAGDVAVRADQMAEVGRDAPAAVLEQSEADQAQWKSVADVARPALTVDEPIGDRVPAGAQSVHVKGTAERGAQVTVNGHPVVVKISGGFETDVPLPHGAEPVRIEVRARDQKGFESVVVRKLSR